MTEKQALEMISLLKEISHNTKQMVENTKNVDNSEHGRDDILKKIEAVESAIRTELIQAIKDLENY